MQPPCQKERMGTDMVGMKRRKTVTTKQAKIKMTWGQVAKQKELILLSIPFVIYALVFYYAPLAGWIMAFQNYKPIDGIFGSAFIGLQKFKFLFVNNAAFLGVIRNTIAMGVICLVLSFVFAIGFALLLNEVVHKHRKKFVQTVSYLPHFLSWVIVCGILQSALSIDGGIVNEILVKLHILKQPVNWFAHTAYFWWIVGFATIWKETGWNSIIYLASITSINPDLYEAASIDGAGRIRKMWSITLPSLKPTIIILLLVNLGNILNTGLEIQYLLTNDLVVSVSQTVDIYVLKYGISQADYSLGTAAGIFKSVVSIVLIFLANAVVKASGEERLF
jgi:putative aldouronate transport system permease protein